MAGRRRLDQIERVAFAAVAPACGPLLQRVMTDRKPSLRPLYWRVFRHSEDGAGAIRAVLLDDGSITVAPGTSLGFDTYFSAFFEAHWWLHTRLAGLVLRVVVEGACTVRMLRREGTAYHLLHEHTCDPDQDGRREIRFAVADESINFRQHGLLFFEVSANQGTAGRFIEASWHAAQPTPPALPTAVRLAIVICTFNREAYLGKVLDAICEDPIAKDAVARVFVINQGRPALAAHAAIAPAAGRLGSRLSVVEQGNFGGAGGFTRGILEAMGDGGLTHVGLLDDDITLEPDTLVRMAAFLSLANDDVVLGGHMLDSVQPMRLYEGGAIFDDSRWFVKPIQHDMDIARTDVLAELATLPAMHYNGWWCFAMSLEVPKRVGLPLPCFIRGDDAEFGTRLYNQGISTISLPGAAVWHEPFYLKLGGWQLYYETRNLLVLGSLHRGFTRGGVVRRQLRHLMLHLLTYRYYSSALILRGIEDFLSGPEILRADPRPLHAGLAAFRDRFETPTLARASVTSDARVAKLPRENRLVYLFWFAAVLFRNAIVPARPGEPVRVPVRDFAWVTLRHTDSVVLDTWWETQMPVFRRSRASFRRLTRQAVGVLVRLYRDGPAAAQRWREATPELTSEGFWHDYLARAVPAAPAPAAE